MLHIIPNMVPGECGFGEARNHVASAIIMISVIEDQMITSVQDVVDNTKKQMVPYTMEKGIMRQTFIT
jgi:hypothetical protein